jgi:hypothetical protein
MDSNREVRTCIRCKRTKPVTDFYKRSNRPTGYNSYCKVCNNETRIEQTQRNKVKAVELLGGKCKCGYNKCYSAMHFHHPDPDAKSDLFHRLRNRTWAVIKEELLRQKCELLCANCHAESHCQNPSCCPLS